MFEKKERLKDKIKAIKNTILEIERCFGKGAIMDMESQGEANIPVISTGALSLDIALGVGGIPKGRLIEIFGPESSGKTTLALHMIAEAQKAGGVAAFIDAEHALDIKYAEKLGVNISELLISQPDNGEQALEITEMLIKSGNIDLIVIDSVAALVPKAEIEGEMGDIHMGLQARLMSQAMRKLTAVTNRHGTGVIFINQIRMKIGIQFGNPETTTGGNALKFYSSIRLDIRRSSVLKNGMEAIGSRVKVKVVKNKMAPPFREAEFDIYYDKGICKEGILVDMGIEKGIILQNGSWYVYKGENLGQGREKVKLVLREKPALFNELFLVVTQKGKAGSAPEMKTAQAA